MLLGICLSDLKSIDRYSSILACRILDTGRALHASHAEQMGREQKIMGTTDCVRIRLKYITSIRSLEVLLANYEYSACACI